MNEHYQVISGVPSAKYLKKGVDQEAGEQQMGEVVSGWKRVFWKTGQEASQELGSRRENAQNESCSRSVC